MIEIKNAFGYVVRRSKNLRGILTHLRENPRVDRVSIETGSAGVLGQVDTSAKLTITWANGHYVKTRFASVTVCYHWVLNRRALKGTELYVDGKKEVIGG